MTPVWNVDQFILKRGPSVGRAENEKFLKFILGRVDLVVIHKKWPIGAFYFAFHCFGE